MEDLEGLNLNLASIKSQFEKKDKADINAKGQPAVDRSASSRSDVLRKRLERYPLSFTLLVMIYQIF